MTNAPHTSYGMHDAEAAAQAEGMTLEELEHCFYQAVVDDYQQAWDPLRRQKRSVLWERAVAQSGVPRYLGAPDDLKLLLMKAVNRKTADHRYRVQSGSCLSFHDCWYVSPGLLNRLTGRKLPPAVPNAEPDRPVPRLPFANCGRNPDHDTSPVSHFLEGFIY